MIPEIDSFLAREDGSQECYLEGCQLMRRYHRPAISAEKLYKAFSKRNPRFHYATVMAKLRYISEQYAPADGEERKAEAPAPAKEESKAESVRERDALIIRAEAEMREAWREAEKLTNALYELGESNDEAVVKKRKSIMNKRDVAMTKYTVLYEAKEHYHITGEIREKEITSVLSKPKAAAVNPKALKETEVKGDANLYELKARRHAIVTHLTRLNNQLNYSSQKKGDTLNPMPACPKREQYEARIKELKAELSIIDGKLVNRE